MYKNPQLTTPYSCSIKHRYLSYPTARRAVKRRNKAAGTKYLRAYQCNVCQFWHVTSQKKDKEEEMKPLEETLYHYTFMGEDDPEFDPDTERDTINAETEDPR